MSINQKTVVLITGASSGIGKETARALLAEGYTVYAAARRVEQMDDLQKLGGILLKMDVTKEEDLIAGVEQIQRTHGGVDILINNAGFGLYGAVEDIKIEEARYQMEVNLFGLARLTQLVLPYMRQKRAGKIINLSSMGGRIYFPFGAWYHASKHALEGWSDCLRFELADFGIDVVVIEPGLIKTEFDGIMQDHLLKSAGNGSYNKLVNSFVSAARADPRRGSSPKVIADVILNAIRVNKPRTRYVAGALARPMIFLRKFFGDRVFDTVLRNQLR